MSDQGIIITLPTFDSKTATPEQCSIHSDYPVIKIRTDTDPLHFNTSIYTFTSDPNNGTYNLLTVAHGYSYTPMAIVYVKDNLTGNFYILPYYTWESMSEDAQYIHGYTDSTNLKIDYFVSNKGGIGHQDMTNKSYTFKYYIFVDNGI